MTKDLFIQVESILSRLLQIDETQHPLAADTALLGAMPEFDSMTVVAILTALEDRFGFSIEDDEIDASVFETVGSLVSFVETKLA
ncbi:MAG: acyl carrier protein [Methylococcales bacterium]|nr:acyl carrier protein [Methylococcales bacterium]